MPSLSRSSSYDISIHALRGEGDAATDTGDTIGYSHFNPRPPWGGRLSDVDIFGRVLKFQSTPSVGRATDSYDIFDAWLNISIHALRGEGDEYKL